MGRTTKALTATQIEKAKPKEKEYNLADGQGLFLRIRPNGAKNWLFNYYRPLTKKRNNLALGGYPELSLAEARAKREEYRALLAKGVDPQSYAKQQVQNEEAQRENTFFKVCFKWYEDIYPLKANEETRLKNWARLEKHIFPIIGDLPLGDIKPRLLVELYAKIGASNTLNKIHKPLGVKP